MHGPGNNGAGLLEKPGLPAAKAQDAGPGDARAHPHGAGLPAAKAQGAGTPAVWGLDETMRCKGSVVCLVAQEEEGGEAKPFAVAILVEDLVMDMPAVCRVLAVNPRAVTAHPGKLFCQAGGGGFDMPSLLAGPGTGYQVEWPQQALSSSWPKQPQLLAIEWGCPEQKIEEERGKRPVPPALQNAFNKKKEAAGRATGRK